jgi:hypothetical protein
MQFEEKNKELTVILKHSPCCCCCRNSFLVAV